MNLPGATGIEIAGALSNSKTCSTSAMLLLTSHDQPYDRAEEVPVNGYLVKPIAQHALLRAIRQVIGARETPDRQPHAMQGDRQRCMDADMDRYVAKPIKPVELFEVIDRVMASATSSAVA